MYLPRFNAEPQTYDGLIAIVPGIAGALGGLLFIWLRLRLTEAYAARLPNVFLQPVLGGLVLGLVGTAAPILLFSGHNEIGEALALGQEDGPLILIVLGLAKAALCAVCLGSRWLGGPIFPLCFTGAALGGAMLYVVPGLDPLIGVAAGMTGASTVGLKKPLLAGAVMIFVIGDGLLLPIFVGAIAGWIVLNRLPEKLIEGGGFAH